MIAVFAKNLADAEAHMPTKGDWWFVGDGEPRPACRCSGLVFLHGWEDNKFYWTRTSWIGLREAVGNTLWPMFAAARESVSP